MDSHFLIFCDLMVEGGLAVFYKSNFNCKLLDMGAYKSFEILSFIFKNLAGVRTLFILIYRPPKSANFILDFAELLSSVTVKFDNIIVLGDFNLHICCPHDPMSTRFLELIQSFNFSQFVDKHTRNATYLI